MIAALLTCLLIGGGFVGAGFYLGRLYERETTAAVYVLPVNRPAHRQRRRSPHSTTRQAHGLRVLPNPDFYDQENPPA